MLHWKSRGAAVVVAMTLAAAFAAPANAEPRSPRPDYGAYYFCLSDPNADAECEGVLCTCCYTDGCWICNNVLEVPEGTGPDCAWEPAMRIQRGQPSRGIPRLQTLQPH